jgi:hypothetical protein
MPGDTARGKIFARQQEAVRKAEEMVLIDSGFQGESSCLLSLIRRSQRVGGVYITYRCMEVVRERRDLYVRMIRWDVTWRAHCDEATREELALVIWKDYSDVIGTWRSKLWG